MSSELDQTHKQAAGDSTADAIAAAAIIAIAIVAAVLWIASH